MANYLVPPGDTRSVWLSGMGVIFKFTGEQTGGLFSVVEHPIEPGRLVRPHMHTREDEFSYVLEGEVVVRIGDQTFQASQGSYVWKPRGIPHTFWNVGPNPARLIELITPAGLENYFIELAGILQQRPPDLAKFGELAARFGHMDEGLEWIPELAGKYHLKLVGE